MTQIAFGYHKIECFKNVHIIFINGLKKVDKIPIQERMNRMKKVSKALLTGAGAAVVGAAAATAAAYASTKQLVKIAMDRQQPKLMEREKTRDQLRGYLNCDEFLDEMEAGAEKLETTPHDTVRLTSYDGQSLVGHWFACKDPKRIIIAMHGWRSGWSLDFGTIAPFWHKNGCCVLYAEQRGQGSSGGEYIGFGMMERYDCLEWIKWVNSHYGQELPVYLAGVSMGATTVLMAADLELPSNVRGIMADCGFTSAHDIWKHVAENNLHLSYNIHGGVADQLCRQKIQMGTRDCSTVASLKNSKVPILFAHGTSDHFVPVDMTYQNYQACIAPKTLLIVPGADHGMSHYVEKARYEQTMLDFWNTWDNRREEK